MRLTVLSVIATGLVLAACGNSATPKAAAGSHPATRQPATTSNSTATAATCMTRLTQWRDGGGLADLQAVGTAEARDAQALQATARADASTQSMARLATVAAELEAAAQTAQTDPAPSCVPHLRTDAATAYADMSQSAQSEINAAQAAQSGDIQTAASDIQAADIAITAGAKTMEAAVTDVTSFAG